MVPEGGQKVRLRLSLIDPTTGTAPRNLNVRAWARPRTADGASCTRAAQNFRATRRIPTGSIDVNGILLAALNRDASLSVIDPKLNLYSSNMVAAHALGRAPEAIAIDRSAMRALYADGAGRIVAADLAGPGRETVADDLGTVTGLAVARGGRIWVGTAAGALIAFSPAGAELVRHEMPGPVRVSRPDDPESDLILARTDGGGVRMLDADTGHEVMAARLDAPLAAVAPVGRDGIIAVTRGADMAAIHYADAPDRAVAVPLGAPFERVTTGPGGRIAVLWTPGDALVALVDLALGRVVQQVSLDAATVSAVTFTDNAAYLLSLDGGFVGAIDLATVALGRPAVLRQVNLGSQTTPPELAERLLVPLLPSPQILAVSPEAGTGWVIGEVASSVEMPPMDSVRLRGGMPEAVYAVDRSFDEVSPGVFETAWAFAPGPWELVVTTDLGELSTCLPFSIQGDIERRRLVPVRLVPDPAPSPRVGEPQDVALTLVDADGEAVELDRLTLMVPSMLSGWSTRVVARRGTDGRLRVRLDLPHVGPYALQPLDLPAPLALVSAAIVTATDQEVTSP